MDDEVSLRNRSYQWTCVAIADLEDRPECIHHAYLDLEDT